MMWPPVLHHKCTKGDAGIELICSSICRGKVTDPALFPDQIFVTKATPSNEVKYTVIGLHLIIIHEHAIDHPFTICVRAAAAECFHLHYQQLQEWTQPYF